MAVDIKISYRWLLTKWHKCEPSFITENCNGKCCGSSKGGTFISLLNNEIALFKRYGANIENNVAKESGLNKCIFKDNNGLCRLHNKQDKPFGCIASPFTLNKKDTLIIRHRYIHLPCFNGNYYAYNVFKNSLILLFGLQTTDKIIVDCKNRITNKKYEMHSDIYNNLKFLDKIKRDKHD